MTTINISHIHLSPTITYLLIDVHGVLTDGQERKRFLAFMDSQFKMDYAKHDSLWVNHVAALDVNQESAADYVAIVNDTFKTHISVEEYYQLVANQIRVNHILLDALEILSKDHQICIVSDNFKEIRDHLASVFGESYSRYRQFYSYEFNKTKATGMFFPVLDQLNADPAECLFIDDSIKNVNVAKTLGINAVCFTTNDQLFTDLKMLSCHS